MLFYLVCIKLAVLALFTFGISCFSIDLEGRLIWGWQGPDVKEWISKLQGWDGNYYLELASEGYRSTSSANAFYPLWPGVIRFFSFLTGCKPVWVGFWVSNFCSLVGIWLFWKLISEEYGSKISKYTLCFLMAFPGALFFCMLYTESLFFLLVIVAFYAMRKEYWFLVGIAVFLLPLTRAVGVFILVPLAWQLWEEKKLFKNWLLLLVPLAGYGAYFGLMYIFTGNALAGFDAQKAYPHAPSIANIFNLSGFWNNFTNMQSIYGMRNSILDRAFFLLLLALLPFVWKLNRTWFFYTLLMGVVPAMTSWFMSYRRYIIVCFPIFVVLAIQMEKSKHKRFYWYYIGLLALLQIVAIILTANYGWSG